MYGLSAVHSAVHSMMSFKQYSNITNAKDFVLMVDSGLADTAS